MTVDRRTGDLEAQDQDQTGRDRQAGSSARVLTQYRADAAKYLLIAGLALLVVFSYVGVAASISEPGFPLDDSWIHQTYARNFAQSGRWAFTEGVVSAGSTSPLWTIALAVGYFLHLPYFLWTSALGWLCLAWAGWAGMGLWEVLWPDKSRRSWLAGAALVITWPLAWAAGSGMETMLFIALTLQLLTLYGRLLIDGRIPVWLLGLLTGLLILVRPDGLGLLCLMAIGLFFVPGNLWARARRSAIFLAFAALPLIPYFALNLQTSGTLWPNTFYAKQSEYAFLWDQPFIVRGLQLLFFALGGPAEGVRGISGAHLLLLPGVVIAIWTAVGVDWRQRRLMQTLPLLWAGGHILLYAWRLPVTYQHGRYLLPTIPIFVMYGLAGWMDVIDIIKDRLPQSDRPLSLGRIFARLTFASFLLIFLILGLQVYVQDVAFINGEMVNAARWLEANTPEEALIAAHDIGAIGYFGDRSLLDLAGLISPEVIPLLSDQEAMVDYVRHSGADYLVTAPGWPYASIAGSEDTVLVYSTGYAWTVEQGINNISIYRLGK